MNRQHRVLHCFRSLPGPDKRPATCSRKPQTSCMATEKAIAKHVDQCENFKELRLCEIQEPKLLSYSFNCSLARVICHSVLFGFAVYTQSNHIFKWETILDKRQYEIYLAKYALEVEFGILKCNVDKNWLPILKVTEIIPEHLSSVQQVFWFTKETKAMNHSSEAEERISPKPSISIIFFDNISRNLFYRTFSATVAFLKELNVASKRKVLDFQLFQPTGTSKHWNLNNLFNGPRADIEYEENIFHFRKSQKFFRNFRRQGYLTSLSWDLCFHQCWDADCSGRRRSLFKKLIKIFEKELNLDNFGLSLMLCDLIAGYLKDDKRFSPSGKCFNGRHLLDYQLSQLAQLQADWLSKNRQFVSYLESNLKHKQIKGAGKHVDPYLKDYLQLMTDYPDTMIVFLSHPGEVKGTDAFHPFLFILLPENETRFFQHSELQNLHRNQNTLTTPRDLHYLFAKFWNDPEGMKLRHFFSFA